MSTSEITLNALIRGYHAELLERLGEYPGYDRVIDFGWLGDAVHKLQDAADTGGDKTLGHP